ncbi:MAG: nitroreductase family protein [Oscillospiraceae bacterium]|nr:nitroreductase family protein [Oscillospiraceae bacterium]
MLEEIYRRRSIRKFQPQEVEEEKIRALLKAGMSGPSAVDARDWSFIVVRERETLLRMAEANGPAADPLREAPLGILICGDTARTYAKAPDFWIVDCSIATQNMVLAAENLDLGCVWLGTWPHRDRVEGQRALFDLPAGIEPHSILAIGYPAETPQRPKTDWEDDRIHWEHW